MDQLKAYILFPGARKNALYEGWLDELPLSVEIVREYSIDWMPPADAGILITHNHYRWEEISILRRVVEQTSVPVLILVDGILEYRNSFEHDDLADGTMFQPLIGHKVACIGNSQTRWLEALGNTGKCEVVGIPRLDDFAQSASKEPDTAGTFRLLVASARTPWFNEQQREETHHAVESVKRTLDQTARLNGKPMQVTWRMAESLHANVGVPGYERRPPPIKQILEQVDAVITTPSTLQLEAAMHGLPVAVLDLHNRPQMTPMAWNINTASQIAQVLEELASPPTAMRFVQETLLADALQMVDAAAPRMAKLAGKMVEAGKLARESGNPIELPARILEPPCDGMMPAQPAGTTQSLFPANPVFRNESISRLQTELSAAIHEMGNYPEKYFDQRTANQKLRGYINWLRLLVRNRAATVEELAATVHRLSGDRNDRPVKDD
ncbi:MAG: hypothetical protein ACR2NP_11040 [Pirellulaceae bacterium]